MADRQPDSSEEKRANGRASRARAKVVHLPLKASPTRAAGISDAFADQANSVLELGAREWDANNPVASRQSFLKAAEIDRSG
jgi:hypothetical protein